MIVNQSETSYPNRPGERRGFTLLEVLLALGLTVFLVAGIGMAIRLHLVTLAKQQREIESKQVARSVLMMISNDIRAAMQYRAQDFSALENLQVSEAMILGIGAAADGEGELPVGDLGAGDLGDADLGGADLGGADLGGADLGGADLGGGDLGGADLGGGDLGGADASGGDLGGADAGGGSGSSNYAGGQAGTTAGGGSGAEGETGGQEAPSFGDAEAEACVSCRPTLFGSANSILVDASRLPRIDEYNPLIASGNQQTQLPSDVKSIAYFVSDQSPVDQPFGSSSNAGGGLYRRQIDRAVAAYLGETDDTIVDQYAKMVAPEVAQISLRYFNGDDWTDAWDSEEDEGYPLAVEVLLVIDPSRANDESGSYQYGGFDSDTMQMYRLVIHLPTAELGGQ